MKTTKTNLINKFNELDLNYLDFTGYNEIEEHDNNQTYDLYLEMFNEFIQPIFNELDKINYDSDYVIFNFFVKDEETNTIKGVFYEPEIEIDIFSNNYNKEIQSAIELITK
ncbi:hypothetical protein [Mammaliicoccus sciuri]|uniref:hypothetical protein n=1 Tax=Mammaliicoccus sciuri TaxID=1296 RepID=UPI002B260D85|nr:hypothetical protein [Mammaliicoccus sciuri]WQK75200.1 hypothetical protein P3U33_05580 [Mammaliicoccus sciuri]